MDMFVDEANASGNVVVSETNLATPQHESVAKMGLGSVDLFADYADEGEKSKLVRSFLIP